MSSISARGEHCLRCEAAAAWALLPLNRHFAFVWIAIPEGRQHLVSMYRARKAYAGTRSPAACGLRQLATRWLAWREGARKPERVMTP